MLEDFRWR